MREIAREVCNFDSGDALLVQIDNDRAEFVFRTSALTPVVMSSERARALALLIIHESGGGEVITETAPQAMTRAEALEAAIAHVTKMTTNDRGYGTVSQTERGQMTLRFAAFLLGE